MSDTGHGAVRVAQRMERGDGAARVDRAEARATLAAHRAQQID